jgi:hypothetical protein
MCGIAHTHLEKSIPTERKHLTGCHYYYWLRRTRHLNFQAFEGAARADQLVNLIT